MAWEPPPEVATREVLFDWWLATVRMAADHHQLFLDLGWGDRLSRLFAVACCRAAFGKKLSKRIRSLRDIGERDADGLATAEEWTNAVAALHRSHLPPAHMVVVEVSLMVPMFAAGHMATLRQHQVRFGQILWAMVGPRGVWSDDWRTETVVGLGRGIYDDHAWDRMPILADALQDAGCNHPQVIAFCRSEGPFCRGCSVIDRILQLR